MIRAIALAVSLLALSGCAALTAATGSLLGRGVNANVQAGAENRQALISQENAAPSVSIRPHSRTGDIRQEVNEVRTDTGNVVVGLAGWQLLLAVILLVLWSIFLWQLPEPSRIWAALRRK
jgi:hypothetical protein